MAMAWIWTFMTVFSIFCAVLTGRIDALGSAVLEGGAAAVTLCLSMAGILCLWTGVISVMREAGMIRALSRLFRPVLSFLFPGVRGNEEILSAISSNVSANLLGLGNAATPMGVKAACLMSRASGKRATDDLCMLVVVNTASIQLIPATVAGVRAGLGAQAPFDILPAVWFTSAMSVLAGVLAAKLLSAVWRRFE
ncbi:nucleoside recognition domain-containing protein [Papillibacter cinnamivorans]|uniref:Spore maturation protein A n=1 Tax=Papillibacter cinnamivorans DSM 12816 TaxID=1122930 RepID=A0A1W1ZZH2_9FIRM|nr:nucleoside recognition domain-containing protein [Papillibacter cinnamivorans]SMC53827.1 spore maturation protein A [Papillibacter cinnamivorans DSM 12816]